MNRYPFLSFWPASLLALLLFLLPCFTAAQRVVVSDAEGSSTVEIKDLPFLNPLNADDPPPPAHEFLYIFSDGSFINKTRDSIVQHALDTKGAPTAEMITNTVVTSVYSGGAPPPDRIGDTTTVTSKAVPSPLSRAVPPGALVNLQRNHTRLVAGHNTTFILSVRNTLPQDTFSSLSGELLLFYDGRIDRIVTEKQDTLYIPKTDEAGDTLFAASAPLEVLDFIGGLGYRAPGSYPPSFYDIEEDALKPHYKKLMRWRFDGLKPEEERRLFITIQTDKGLLEKAPEKEKGLTRLLAMALLDDFGQQLPAPLLAQEEQAWLEESGILEGLSDGLSVSISGDGTTIGSDGIMVMDIYESAASVAKGHDPNRLSVEACECPADSELGQKLLVTVEYENDGSGDVNTVFIRMDLPEGMSPYRIPDTLAGSHPAIRPEDIEISRTGNSITWKLSNMLIRPVMDFGAGHPSTFGSITFYAYLEKGTGLDILSGRQACIRFGAETEPAVCTPPAIINLATPDDPTYGRGALDCGACEAASIPVVDNGPAIPWWLGLLILFVVVVFFFIARLFWRNR